MNNPAREGQAKGDRMTTENMTETERSTALARLGFALECTGPVGHVEPAKGKDGKPWPCIRYQCRLTYGGREIWGGPYSLGIGHVKPSERTTASWAMRTDAERSMLACWTRKPNADFKDKGLQADVAARLAIVQKVKPTLASMLYSLLLDGEAFFSGQTFEEWCGDFGYDTDSRSAEETWRLCDATGRALSKVPKDDLAKAREILDGY